MDVDVDVDVDVDELKKKILELNEHYQDKLDHKPSGTEHFILFLPVANVGC